MAVTAIVNQKGGVGKTTVTLGLAAVLSAAGDSVLMVDLDPQANATTGSGVWSPSVSTAQVLDGEEPGSIGRCVVEGVWDTAPPGRVDLAPGSPSLARLEHDLATDPIGGGDRLVIGLDGVTGRYDHVLIDCPPSLGLLTVNALFAADDVVVVAEPAAWSVDGVAQILRNVSRVASRRDGRLQVRGIAVNKLARTRDSRHWDAQLRSENPELVVGPAVRLRAVVAEAAAHGLPVTMMTRSGSSEAVEELTALAAAFGFIDPPPRAVEDGDGHDDVPDGDDAGPSSGVPDGTALGPRPDAMTRGTSDR